MRVSFHIGSLIGIVFIVFLATAGPAQSGAWFGKKAAPAVPGQQAPEFSLPNLKGQEVELAQFRGKFVLVGFWASWCPPCRHEMPSLETFYRKYTGRDLALLTINVGEPRSEVESFVAKNGLTFPVLLDPEGRVQKRYGAFQFPIFFLLDPQGQIVAQYLGLRDWNSPEVRRELAEQMRN